jgi:hypothetical protein
VQTESEERFVLLSDASTQVLDWQSLSNDELHDELAFRLSDHQFAMTSRYSVPLVQCYTITDVYKRWGATYHGDAKQRYYPPGTDLRTLLRQHPEWLQNPDRLRREILLRIMSEVDRSPFLIKRTEEHVPCIVHEHQGAKKERLRIRTKEVVCLPNREIKKGGGQAVWLAEEPKLSNIWSSTV